MNHRIWRRRGGFHVGSVRFLFQVSLLLFFAFVKPAEAVVPQLWSLMQGVLSFLPQIFLFLIFAISLLFKWSTWKSLFERWRRRPSLVSLAILLGLALGIGGYIHFTGNPRASLQTSPLSDWSMLGRTPLRTGSLSADPVEGVERWKFRATLDRAPFNSSPAIAGDRVYVGSDNDTLYCFDADTGDTVWQFEARYEVFSSPAVVDGRVYFGEGLHYVDDALFYCLDARSGDVLWKFQTTSHTESSPTVVDGKVIFGAGEDGVYCLDAVDGKEIWHFPGVHVDASPLAFDGRVYFGTGYGQEGFYCVAQDTGREIWHRELELPAWGGPAGFGDRIYFGVGNGNFDISDPIEPQGGVFCMDSSSGETIWYFSAQDAVLTSIALVEGRAYFGSRDGYLYCVDRVSGDEIWRYDAASPILSSPAVAGNTLYFGSNRGEIHAVGTSTGKALWTFDTGRSAFNTDTRILASPAVAAGRLYVGSMNFFFYCLD